MNRNRHKLIAYILAAAAVLVSAVWWLSRPDPIEVLVEVVEKGSVQDTVANTKAGTIEACRRAGISPRMGGQIAFMPVSEGDVVEKDQILMEFWNDYLLAQKSWPRAS